MAEYDMRNRLAELYAQAKQNALGKEFTCTRERNMYVANFLIANGVTVQGWISVKDRLPDREDANEGGFVLAHTEEKIIIVRWGNICRFPEFVTHWMPLPPAPKGV